MTQRFAGREWRPTKAYLESALRDEQKRLLDVRRKLAAAEAALSRETARADKAEETLRLTRDGADLLVGAEERAQALEAKLREACGGSEPSEGHDEADEVIGLLRVARSQRDDAERALSREKAARERAEAEVRNVALLCSAYCGILMHDRDSVTLLPGDLRRARLVRVEDRPNGGARLVKTDTTLGEELARAAGPSGEGAKEKA